MIDQSIDSFVQTADSLNQNVDSITESFNASSGLQVVIPTLQSLLDFAKGLQEQSEAVRMEKHLLAVQKHLLALKKQRFEQEKKISLHHCHLTSIPNQKRDGMAEHELPHQLPKSNHPPKLTQSQSLLRAGNQKSPVPSTAQISQFCICPQKQHNSFENAPFLALQLGLARSQTRLQISSKVYGKLDLSHSKSSANSGTTAQQDYKLKREEQKQVPPKKQEGTKLKLSSKPRKKFKQYFNKCAVLPNYQKRKEEIRPIQIAYRTSGRRSQKTLHHEEIIQHYSKEKNQ